MTRTAPTIDDELLDAICEDERAEIIEKYSASWQIDDEKTWTDRPSNLQITKAL